MPKASTTILVALSAGLLFVGCKKNDEKKDQALNPASTTLSGAQDTASEKSMPSVMDPTQVQFEKCWAAYNAKDEATFKSCYDDTAQFDMVDSTPPKKAKARTWPSQNVSVHSRS